MLANYNRGLMISNVLDGMSIQLLTSSCALSFKGLGRHGKDSEHGPEVYPISSYVMLFCFSYAYLPLQTADLNTIKTMDYSVSI